MLLQLLRNVMPLNDGSCRIKMPVVRGRYAPDVLLDTTNVGGLKIVTKTFYQNKNIYNECAKLIEGCNVAFHTNDCWNLP